MSETLWSSLLKTVKRFLIGGSRNPEDKSIFHKLSLIAFFAWVGLGADGVSSSCYGPPEAFLALKEHPHLAIFVALATVITIFIVSTSYSHIIELFPTGGGGYLVASKLLSPAVGMVSGCALVIDYVLTITLSIASGTDAIFSFLPSRLYGYRLDFALFVLAVLILLNLRGTKESVVPLVPVFLTFIATHAIAIVYALVSHLSNFTPVVTGVAEEVRRTTSTLGLGATIFLVLKAYSMGAGTFTGIEAVSNGIPILREPKVKTAKHTMLYMAFSLSLMVVGLMLAYLLFRVSFQDGKTLNAVLFEGITLGWPSPWGKTFLLVTLLSEATILVVAAQTGFLDGPRVLSNMALDRWMPSRFANLSNRLVTQNGILMMGIGAFILMVFSKGSVAFLIVLYSINVFITFSLSQLGMVRHWWKFRRREPRWLKKLTINGIGLILTSFILVSVSVIKFHEGGWLTIVVTGSLASVAFLVKRHYRRTGYLLRRLEGLTEEVERSLTHLPKREESKTVYPDLSAQTAVILVNGFNGLGLHTLFNVLRLFGKSFKNYVFVEIGIIDAGVFKGVEEMEAQKEHVERELEKYLVYMRGHGYYAESFCSFGIDPVEEVVKIAPEILERFSQAVFFGGKLVFAEDTFASRLLHNNVIMEIQRQFYRQGIPVVVLPIRV